MSRQIPYQRTAAVEYAHQWAYRRNPKYNSFDRLGGDCTNFASQCLYAGSGIMDSRPDVGWYYYGMNNRSPSWTGVVFFYHFLIRRERTVGPTAIECGLDSIEPGDFVQLRFQAASFGHTPVIVSVGMPPGLDTILVAAHSDDSDNRPLSSYHMTEIRFLHMTGVTV